MYQLLKTFSRKEHTFSFEFFPPKTDKGRARLYEAAATFAELRADFFSVTYGAGGSTSKATLEIVRELQRRFGLPVVHHYTCVQHSHEDIREALDEMRRSGVRNILAMRGDPPRDEPNYRPGHDEPKFGCELVEMIHHLHRDWFTVGVPGFPEGHVQAPTKRLDSEYLKIKQDAGAEFVITQMFFDNDLYSEFVDRVRGQGVTMRLIPGIMPIKDYPKLADFCDMCGATIPPSIRDIFEPIRDKPDETYKRGLELVTRQCRDLIEHRGAPGLHFFCLNQIEPAVSIYRAVQLQGIHG